MVDPKPVLRDEELKEQEIDLFILQGELTDENNEVDDVLFVGPELLDEIDCEARRMNKTIFILIGSPLPTRMPSISTGSTTEKRKISPTTYETVTKGSSIKPRTEHEELMRYIPQLLQRFIEKIDNTPKDELIRKHLSAELKKDKKMYEMIEGRNIDEGIRNTQARKSAEVAGWLKMPLFWYAIANHLRRPYYYFSLDSMHTYIHTSIAGSILAPPIDGWWLRKSSSRNKNLRLQSLENDLNLFQKLIPSCSGGAVINLD
ncbi:hypothetical protein BY996DRAFT_6453050 [Phakopsora pachyrhizi]|nr:hypothetical protein BY996DRAFT_6453050 [Phakopsora pachyrhizi]